MVWQDILISACQFLAVFSLIPSITSDDKPALKTSIINVVLVTCIATSILTLHLWFSAATAYMIAAAWLVLAYQKYKIDKSR